MAGAMGLWAYGVMGLGGQLGAQSVGGQGLLGAAAAAVIAGATRLPLPVPVRAMHSRLAVGCQGSSPFAPGYCMLCAACAQAHSHHVELHSSLPPLPHAATWRWGAPGPALPMAPPLSQPRWLCSTCTPGRCRSDHSTHSMCWPAGAAGAAPLRDCPACWPDSH